MLNAHSSDRDPPALSLGSVALAPPGALPGQGDKPAGALREGASPDAEGPVLEGRRIGLICDSRHAPSAVLFIEAAEGMGAQVSVLHAGDVISGGTDQQDKLLRMLARLYDAIECQDLPPAAVRRISELVAVPVLANLGGAALRGVEPAPSRRDTDAWAQGLARVREALLRAL